MSHCCAGDDAEFVPVDISNLSPQEAITQLQAQNRTVIARAKQLKAHGEKHTHENEQLKQQLSELRTYTKEVEADRTKRQDMFHRMQLQHKCVPDVRRLQCFSRGP